MTDIIIGRKTRAYDLLDMLVNKEKLSYEPPIDIYAIAKELGCDITYISEPTEIVGEIKVSAGKPTIIVNKTNNYATTRERFTIAHEIGHLCLHIAPKGEHAYGGFVDTSESLKRSAFWDAREYEANTFAAQLLMPKDLIIECGQKIVDGYIRTFEDKMPFAILVQELADRFEVSCQAMEYRLKNLGVVK
jgi:Zn-dependent peptidase ImmA (M78 family)